MGNIAATKLPQQCFVATMLLKTLCCSVSKRVGLVSNIVQQHFQGNEVRACQPLRPQYVMIIQGVMLQWGVNPVTNLVTS